MTGQWRVVEEEGAEEMSDSKEAHREFAIKSNGRIWTLLVKADRCQLEDDELLYAAYASCYHWLQAGAGVHQQRGEYLIAKAHISLGHPSEALRHARRCLALTEEHRAEMKDFDLAYAYECLARAQALNGDVEEAGENFARARALGDEIKGAEDKKIFDGDMDGGDWFGLMKPAGS